MVLMVGSSVGTLIQSISSDMFGRRKTYLLSLLLLICTSISTGFITGTVALFVVRFASGLTSSAVFTGGFVIGMELVGPSKRMLAGMLIEVVWVLSMFLQAGMIYLVRDWKTNILILTCPSVMFLLYYWFIPESPRWLLAKGRIKEAEAIIRRAATINKVTLTAQLFDIQSTDVEEEPKGKLIELFTNKTLAIRSIIISFQWMVASLTFYGLTLHVSHLSGNVIVNFTLFAVAELAAYILCMVFLDRIGRRSMQCVSFLIGGVACACSVVPVMFSTGSHGWILVVLSLVGRFGASSAFAIIYIFTAELYPTPVRNMGLGFSNLLGRVGGMMAPYIADLGILIGGSFKDALPMLVFGCFAIAAGLLTLLLPETLHQNLPETVEDVKNMSRTNTSTQEPKRQFINMELYRKQT